MHTLFSFRNEFDCVTVGLEDDSGDIRVHGPFTVSVTFDSPEVATDNTSETFPLLVDARAKFLELVGNEIDAVLSQG